MILSTGQRVLVERLLSGDIRPQDLTTLFFSMREETGGRGIVSEIAHFLAHPAVRTQGLVTSEIRDQVMFLRLYVPYYTSPLLLPALPANAKDALRANFRRLKRGIIKKELRMNPVHAERILEKVMARMIPTVHGGLTKAEIRSPEELRVFSLVATYAKGGPIFTDDDLFDDFSKVLRKRGIIKTTEMEKLKAIKPALALFALTAMHGNKIDLRDGQPALLAIARDMNDKLGIFAIAGTAKAGQPINVACWVLQTRLSVDGVCDPDVAPHGRAEFVGDFEMSPNLKLARRTS